MTIGYFTKSSLLKTLIFGTSKTDSEDLTNQKTEMENIESTVLQIDTLRVRSTSGTQNQISR